MRALTRIQPWLIGIMIGIMIALLVVPTSRSILVEQFIVAGGVSSTLFSQAAVVDARARQVARQYPNDAALQLAATDSVPSGLDAIDRSSADAVARQRRRWVSVEALAARYPNSPVIAAASLRAAMPEIVGLSSEGDASAPKTDGKDAAQFIQDAVRGEGTDPDNAYFALMQAVGFSASGRMDEADAAVIRAAEKPRWNEYLAEETEGRWRLAEARYGWIDAFGRAAISASALYPQHASLRELARRVKAQAIHDEQTGKVAQGIALRHAIMHCGSLMRAQSTTAIGSLVGIALVNVVMLQPGGAQNLERPSTMPYEQYQQLRLDQYCAFLMRHGQDGEARWARAELAADAQADATLLAGLNAPDRGPVFLYGRLLLLLVEGTILLMNILWIVLMGGIAAACLWLSARRARAAVPVKTSLLRGALVVAGLLGLATLLAEPLLTNSTIPMSTGSDVSFWAIMLAFLAGIAFLMLQALRLRVAIGEGLRILGLGTMIAALGLAAFLMTAQQSLSVPVMLSDAASPTSLVLNGNQFILWLLEPEQTPPGETINLKYAALILSVPFTLFCLLTLIIFARRMPYLRSLARGFAALCVPVLTLLVTGCAALILVTVRQENQLTHALILQNRAEGPYLASLMGQSWPGAVPPVDNPRAHG